MKSKAVIPDALLSDWNGIPDALQILIAGSALQRAVETLAHQAELLAAEMEDGALSDFGGADALRLFAAIARIGGRDAAPVAGHA